MIKRLFSNLYIAIILFFLYAPILVMCIISFNGNKNATIFSFGHFKFGFYWFGQVFSNQGFSYSLLNTFVIAILSTLISLVIGVFAAISLSRIKSTIGKLYLGINKIPIINADIVIAFSLLLTFLGAGMPFGFFSLLLAHVSFCLPYVVVTILARIRQINKNVIEAALDLGATPFYTVKSIIIPMIIPSILISSAISFSMSFDDFIISYFTGGNIQNISVYMYTLKHFTPILNAFFVILILVISISFIINHIRKEILIRKNAKKNIAKKKSFAKKIKKKPEIKHEK